MFVRIRCTCGTELDGHAEVEPTIVACSNCDEWWRMALDLRITHEDKPRAVANLSVRQEAAL